MQTSYWLDHDRNPKPLIDLGEARCRRCPLSIGRVPVDKVWLHLHYDATRVARVFVCPYCRTRIRTVVDADEALRLFASGVATSHASDGRPPTPALDANDVIAFSVDLQAADDVAARAAFDPPQGT